MFLRKGSPECGLVPVDGNSPAPCINLHKVRTCGSTVGTHPAPACVWGSQARRGPTLRTCIVYSGFQMIGVYHCN